MPRRTFAQLVLPGLLACTAAVAQPPLPDRYLEDRLIASSESDQAPDLDDSFLFHASPRSININEADTEELRLSGLFSERQVRALLAYRAWAGPLLSWLELQAVPFFDTAFIRRLRPLVTTRSRGEALRPSLDQLRKEGRGSVRWRWGRYLERARGFLPGDSSRPAFPGSPDRLTLLGRWRYGRRLFAGFSADKDPGEALWAPSGRRGFDHYGVHLFLRDLSRRWAAIALGDYRVSLGQGLLLHSGFGYGKGAAAVSVHRGGPRLRPHRSSAETGFLRGLAARLRFGPRIELTAFVSRRKRDGNRVDSDPEGSYVTSLSNSGLHRTAHEAEDRKAVTHHTLGFSLRWSSRRGHVALNGLHDRLSLPLRPTPRPYNAFYFRGRWLTNASLDYSFFQGQVHHYGEMAWSDNGGLATLNGLTAGLGRALDLALVFRHFAPDYRSLWASAFGEAANNRNETGLYLGMVLRPLANWSLTGYVDAWRHPWLRFRVDAPSVGREWRLRLTFEKRRRLTAYLEVRNRTKEGNAPGPSGPLRTLIPYQSSRARFHLEPHINRSLRLRFRLDWGGIRNPVHGRQTGICLLQDVLYRPVGKAFSFTARFALFDSPGYSLRFYHYENGLLGRFSIPPYYGRGSRWYVNLRFRPARALTAELRLAQTYFTDRTAIGSGHDAIGGPRRTEVAAQLQLDF